ncbi:MAG: SagB family peptide dehydrogenase [Bryobacteraceae bacterium]
MTANDIKGVQYSLVPHFDTDDYSITETFHEFTKLNRENIKILMERVGTIVHDPRTRTMMARSWKTYRGHQRIQMPPPQLGEIKLEDALRARRSLSAFHGLSLSGEPITFAELGGVLGLSYGVTAVRRIPETTQDQGFRAATSAGGIYPLEIYAVVFRVDGLEEGIYHYRAIDHSLEAVRLGPCQADFLQLTAFRDMCLKAATVLVISAVFRRNLCKYLHRGYRFMMNDAGAVVQNMYLTGTALGLGTCALGGFLDDDLGRLLGIDNVEEAPILGFVLGRLS